VVARARNVQHWYALRDRGVVHIERETLDASLMSARSVLELMGWQPHRARTLAMRSSMMLPAGLEGEARMRPRVRADQCLCISARLG
jgi:glutathione-regulated potassium-efflux system ancillary protein KefC